MSDGIYIGMAGAAARAEQLEAIADNLANAQTPGFKAARPAFESFLAASGAPDQAFPVAVAAGFDMRPGPAQRTGQSLDVFLEGHSFLPVRAPNNTVAYTRNGKLSVDADGMMRAGGYPLLQASGEPIILPPQTKPEIMPTGEVRVGGRPYANLPSFQLDGQLMRVGSSLMVPGPGGRASPVTTALRVGELEGGNLNPLEAAVDMVSAQRHYETSMQALQTYRRLDDRANEVGRVK